MQPEQAPSKQAPSPTALDIYRAYASVLPGWLRRFRISPPDAEDIMQEVWLGICDGSVPMPSSVRDARLELFKVTKRIAIRMRRRELRDALRHVPDPDDCAENVDVEEHAMNALAVFEALERLASPHRELAYEHCILGHTIKQMAEHAGIPEGTMGKRVWRALAELEKLRQKDQKQEERQKKKTRQNGLLVAPYALDLDPETRAAFCAIWDAEGRLPQFGGPTHPPPPPPAMPLPSILLPFVGAAPAAAVVAVVAVVLAIIFLVFGHLWDPPQAQTAKKGFGAKGAEGDPKPQMFNQSLRAPAMSVIEDVDQVVPIYFPVVQPPTMPNAGSGQTPTPTKSSASVRSTNTSSSSPPLDPEEINRARRRQTPRFLPSR